MVVGGTAGEECVVVDDTAGDESPADAVPGVGTISPGAMMLDRPSSGEIEVEVEVEVCR